MINKLHYIIIILPILLFTVSCSDKSEEIPEFTISNTGPYMLNMTYMDTLKSRIDHPFVQEELNRLILIAEDFLINDFEFVTDKSEPPPSGDINDYMSLARYLWPDSTGAFTINRDGITNPKIYQYDRPKLDRISTAILFLSLAYFYTEEEKFAERATTLISDWFLDSNTMMNPNLNFAQVALGVNNNRGNHQGIIDTIDFIRIIDSISLIYESWHWTSNKHLQLKAWFYSFSRWIDRKYNADAFCSETWCNNISTWIDAQKTIYFLFTEQDDRLNSASSIQPLSDKIALQFSEVGIQRDESTRTLSQHYFYFNLSAYMHIALMRKHRTGFDRDWQVLNSPDFGGLKPSLDVLVDYLNGEDVSAFFRHSDNFDNCRYLEIFRPAAIVFEHPPYEEIAQTLIHHCRSVPEFNQFHITLTLPPLEWLENSGPDNSSSL